MVMTCGCGAISGFDTTSQVQPKSPGVANPVVATTNCICWPAAIDAGNAPPSSRAIVIIAQPSTDVAGGACMKPMMLIELGSLLRIENTMRPGLAVAITGLESAVGAGVSTRLA